jgi:uncharacterized protein YaiI (UPF0178 family)
MTLWIDGDACPRAVREIVFRAAERVAVSAVMVANRAVRVPRSRWVRAVQVPLGFDVVDRYILREASTGDVVVTDDVPLAAALVARGVHPLSPRGEAFSADNVGERLAVRDLLQDLRDVGAVTGGPAAFRPADSRRLANALDRLLTRALRERGGA